MTGKTSSRANIHPTAIVAPGAHIPASCTIGPYCTIGSEITLGEDCTLISHVVLEGHITFGRGNTVSPFSCLGIAPQDLKYVGESTRVTIGNNNTIREYVTISRGTTGGGGLTSIGSDCLFMANAHIGHDSHVGSHCIFANAATLAGHVVVEDYAVVGAFSAVHQFCRVGKHAYLGGGTMATLDVLPYSITSAERNNHAYSINKIGLERRGFTPAQIKQLRAAYRLLQSSKRNTSDAIAAIRESIVPLAGTPEAEHVTYLLDFIATSKRGIIK